MKNNRILLPLAAFAVSAFVLAGCQQQPAAVPSNQGQAQSTGAQSMSLSIVPAPTQQQLSEKESMGLEVAPSQQMMTQQTSTKTSGTPAKTTTKTTKK